MQNLCKNNRLGRVFYQVSSRLKKWQTSHPSLHWALGLLTVNGDKNCTFLERLLRDWMT